MREGVQQRELEASRATNTKEPSPCSHQVPSTSTVQLSTQSTTKAKKELSRDLPQGWGHPSVPLTPTVCRTLCPVSRLHH